MKRFYRLQHKNFVLVLVFFLFSAGSITTGYFYFNSFSQKYRAGVENSLDAIANLKTAEIVQWRKERIADATLFFKNGLFTEILKNYRKTPDSQKSKNQIRNLFQTIEQHYQFEKITLFDTTGVEQFSLDDQAISTSQLVLKEIPNTFKSDQIVIVDLYRHETNQKIYLSILIPVTDGEKQGKILGVVCMRISPEKYLFPLIQSFPFKSKTAETLIVRREQDSVEYLNVLLFSPNSALRLKFPLTRTDIPAVQAVLGKEGITTGVDYRNEMAIASLRRIPDSPWFLVARINAEEVDQVVAERFWFITIIFAGLTLGAIGMVGFVFRKEKMRTDEESRNSLKKLMESEKLYRLISENSSDVIWTLNLASRKFTYVSPSVFNLRGWTPEEVMSEPMTAAMTKESGELIALMLPKRIKAFLAGDLNKRVGTTEVNQIHKDGSIIPTEVVTSLITDQDGNVVEILGISRNITERKKAEIELKNSEERYRDLFEHNPHPMFVINKKTMGFMAVNESALTHYGFSQSEFLSMKLSDIHISDENETFEESFSKNPNSVRKVGMKKHRRKDGSIMDLEITTHELTFEGEPCRLVLANDVTVQKKAVDAVKMSEKKYRQLHENLMDGFVNVSMEGVFVEWNEIFKSMLGYSDEELRKLTYVDLTPEKWHKFEQEVVVDQIINRGYSDIYEKEYRRKDGSIFPVELHTVLMKDDAGTPTGMWAIVRNISERKKAEEELIYTNQQLEGTLNALPDLFFELDLVGNIYSYHNSKQSQLYVRPDLFKGKKIKDILPADAMQIIEKALAEANETGEHFGAIYSLEMNNDIQWYELSISRIGEKNNSSARFITLVRDITSRQQAEEEIRKLNSELENRVMKRTFELEAANKELEAFSYSVSHDLRAPLRHISGFVELLTGQIPDNLSEKGKHYLSVIDHSARQMGNLIDDLLQFSRTGRSEMKLRSVDMGNVVKEIIRFLTSDFENRIVKWEIQPLPTLTCDSSMLKLVWMNLIDNALKFTKTRDTAKIEIGFEERTDDVLFYVKDNGVGFEMAYSNKLFGVFQRLHKQEEFSGTGIGLANVKRIILRHGGQTWADSEIDKSATFYFTLPKNSEVTL